MKRDEFKGRDRKSNPVKTLFRIYLKGGK